MFRRGKEELKLEGLQIQYDLLEALVVRHKIWADDCLDPELENVHMEIIELIWQTREKYSLLLILPDTIVWEGHNFHKEASHPC